MTLVQPPGVLDRNPQQIKFFEHDIERLVGALQHRGKGEVEPVAFAFEQLPGGMRLGHALRGEIHVRPAGEAVFLVPCGFAVAKEHDLVHDKQIPVPKKGRRVSGKGRESHNYFIIVVLARVRS